MNSYQQLLNDCKEYISARYDWFRLELLDKLARILGLIVMLLVLLFLGFAAFAYFSVALVHLMINLMPAAVACTILGLFFVITLVVLYCLRERLFINPFVKLLSGILFAPETPVQQDSEQAVTNKEMEVENGKAV